MPDHTKTKEHAPGGSPAAAQPPIPPAHPEAGRGGEHDRFAVWSTMQAKPGREQAARDFLREAAGRLGAEPGTTNFYAMEMEEGAFAIFNLFVDGDALGAHIGGETAAWVRASREALFVEDYAITKARIFATKQSETSKA